MSVIKKESRRLGETTSLKGIARIIKSKHPCLRMLWLVSVMVCLSIAFFQTYVLIAQYLRYPEITDLDEHSVDLLHDKDIELPHLTLCNLNPLSERAYHFGLLTLFDDVRQAPQWLQNANESVTDNHGELQEELLSPRGFFSVLGRNLSAHAGHSQQEFVASCKILILQGLDLEEEDCEEFGVIVPFQHPKYFNCYQFSMKSQTETSLMVGYSVVLQLGNQNIEWLKHVPSQRKYQLGAMVVLNEPGTYPMIRSNGHLVAPGNHVSLRYRLEQRNRLPPPHGHCRKHEDFDAELQRHFNVSVNYLYTKSACVSLNLEMDVILDCGCIDYTLMQILEGVRHIRSCGASYDVDRVLAVKELICARHVRRTRLQETMRRCSAPCHELRYIPEISESMWPPHLTHNLYKELIEGHPYENNYTLIKQALNSNDDEDLNAAAMTQIRQNFVNIDVYLGRLRVLNVSDAPKVTFTMLISQLGGMLNLWSGITVVLLVEFAEYLLRVFVLPTDN